MELWWRTGDYICLKTAVQSWTKTLGDDAFTGVTDLVMDPRDPDRLYAATWQHQRTIASFMSRGPGSAIHLSTDGGKTWTKLTNGLPKGNMGKICLAISPQNPDVIYTDIELDRRTVVSGGPMTVALPGRKCLMPFREVPDRIITRNSMPSPHALTGFT